MSQPCTLRDDGDLRAGTKLSDPCAKLTAIGKVVMLPSSIIALAILIVAVLPGAAYTWTYEREAASFGVTAADRTLRLIGVSAVFHVLFAWPEYAAYRNVSEARSLATGQFAELYIGVLLLLAIPAACGTTLGRLFVTQHMDRSDVGRLRRRLGTAREQRLLRVVLGRDPAPRAWDDIFVERPSLYVRARAQDGTWVAGRFDSDSYAAGFPQDPDIYLEDAWEIDQTTGELGETSLGYSLYLPSGSFAWLELVSQQRSP